MQALLGIAMLQDCQRDPQQHSTVRTTAPAKPRVLSTARLTLRAPTLADVHTIAGLANDARIAENLRRMPHPYTRQDATDFISATADGYERVFLIERESASLGMIGLDHADASEPELGYWLGVDHWGRGYATEAARAVIEHAFANSVVTALRSGARVSNEASRHVLEKCGFQWSGVALHRFASLGSSAPVDCLRLERTAWTSHEASPIAARHSA